jgi:hypothetical protein
MPAGRPLKFGNVEDLQQRIAEYFTKCQGGWEQIETYEPLKQGTKHIKIDGEYQYEKVKKMIQKESVTPTISGLAVHLDTSRETLLEYEDRPEFVDTIKRAKQTIEAMTESLLVNGGAQPAGVIFNLKNNYGWRDKTETEVTGDPVKVLLQKFGVIGGDDDRKADESISGSSQSSS